MHNFLPHPAGDPQLWLNELNWEFVTLQKNKKQNNNNKKPLVSRIRNWKKEEHI